MSKKIGTAMILPKKKDYINICENCFHVHEIKEDRVSEDFDRAIGYIEEAIRGPELSDRVSGYPHPCS